MTARTFVGENGLPAEIWSSTMWKSSALAVTGSLRNLVSPRSFTSRGNWPSAAVLEREICVSGTQNDFRKFGLGIRIWAGAEKTGEHSHSQGRNDLSEMRVSVSTSRLNVERRQPNIVRQHLKGHTGPLRQMIIFAQFGIAFSGTEGTESYGTADEIT